MIRIFWQELINGLAPPEQLFRVMIRLVAATLLGSLVGIQRESYRKPAGLRTHVLVCVATAAFIITCKASGMSLDGVSRVIQGIVTGIGFIGAGTILKLSHEHAIKGLTTAASVWMTAAIGVIVGLGSLGIALIVAVLALIILSLARLEHSIEDQILNDQEEHNHTHLE
ncbi:MAG TPA: MgtC/SapB family protein [Pyrinomonadaceae bacterium]|nr:MgtC/SapB family protein [Pyrinomonadaceae bacterium]